MFVRVFQSISSCVCCALFLCVSVWYQVSILAKNALYQTSVNLTVFFLWLDPSFSIVIHFLYYNSPLIMLKPDRRYDFVTDCNIAYIGDFTVVLG